MLDLVDNTQTLAFGRSVDAGGRFLDPTRLAKASHHSSDLAGERVRVLADAAMSSPSLLTIRTVNRAGPPVRPIGRYREMFSVLTQGQPAIDRDRLPDHVGSEG